MAIKGKGRARSGRRVIAARPRPQLVVRKPPLWKRRWLQATVAGIVAAAILFGLFLRFRHEHARAFKAREVGAVLTFSNKSIRAFPPGSQTIPPDAYVFYPALVQDLDKLSKGTLRPADAITEATKVETTAADAQHAIQQINLAALVPTTYTASTLPGVTGKGLMKAALLDSQFTMEQAFQLYSEAGHLMKLAAQAAGAERTNLVDQAKALLSQGGAVFDQGFRILLDVRSTLGVPLQVGSGATGTPGG